MLGIYPSSFTFTNIHFLTKIEFSNVVKCRGGGMGLSKVRP